MSALPTGWTVSNKEGASAGPARRPSLDSDDSDGSEHGIDIQPDSPGWEDAEADEEEDLSIKCLSCDRNFNQSRPMLDHCKNEHGLDLLATCKQHALDFYGAIKLVNYIRTQVTAGQPNLSVNDPTAWQDDRFMQPAMEDDALLFSLDELVDDMTDQKQGEVPDYDERQTAMAAKEQKTDLDDLPE